MEHDTLTKYWLWLVMVLGVAAPNAQVMLKHEGGVRNLYRKLHDPECGVLTPEQRRRLEHTDLHRAEQVMEYCNEHDIHILTWSSKLYPHQLRHIYDPPLVLFYRGNKELFRRIIFTVVGTRRPSQYSLTVAEQICGELARAGLLLASGGAIGIDTCAHSAAVRQGAPTISVMGCGVDFDYPKENRSLRERIVENGLLISEYFPGTGPNAPHFPVRNRILSGISEGVLVVEAGAKSGSLITANLACEQGKNVFCVPPHDLTDVRYRGTVDLLRDGAYTAYSAMDILSTLLTEYPFRLSCYKGDDLKTERKYKFSEDEICIPPVKKEQTEEQEPKKASPAIPEEQISAPPEAVQTADPELPQEQTPAEEQPSEKQNLYRTPCMVTISEEERQQSIAEHATPEQQTILKLLQDGEQNTNAICELTGMRFEEASILLIEMEMMGWIRNSERDMYTLPGAEA